MKVTYRHYSVILLLLLLAVCSTGYSQQTRYWVGSGAGVLNWNTNSNWSDISGGPGGFSFPSSGDIAIFDGANGNHSDCLLNVAINVMTLTMSGYVGTISQSSFDLTVSGKLTISTGNFLGTNRSIKLGSFQQDGGNFTSTTSTLTIGGNSDFTSGVFNHNSGLINFFTNNANGSSIIITGSPVLHNVLFNSNSYTFTHLISDALSVNDLLIDVTAPSFLDITLAANVTVNGTLTFDGTGSSRNYVLRGGILLAKGDIVLNAGVSNTILATGNTTVEIAGNGPQNLSSSVSAGLCRLPDVKINKPSGSLSLTGIITVAGPTWSYLSGDIIPGTSTVYFYQPPGASPIQISGSHTLGDVMLSVQYSIATVNGDLTVNDFTLDATPASLTLNIANSITVNDQLTLKGNTHAISINTGTINLKGDAQLLANYSVLAAGSATLAITGSGSQTITGNTTLGNCVIPKVLINKPSGTLTLANTITVQGDWNFVSGDVDATSSTVYLNDSFNSLHTIDAQGTSSNMSFNNLRMNNSSYTYTLGGSLNVNGDLVIEGSTILTTSASNYPINLGGNFTKAASALLTANNSILTLNGLADQSITLNGTSVNSLVVNKIAGKVILLAPLGVKAGGSLVLTNGTVSTTLANILTLNNGATTTIGNAGSYINGPIAYVVGLNGTRTINLPIGEGSAWRPAVLTVTHTAVTPYTYVARLNNASAQALGYSFAPTIQHVSGVRYWQIGRNSSTNFASAVVKLQFDTDDEVLNLAKLGIAQTINAGTTWTDVSSGISDGVGSPNLVGTITSTTLTNSFTGFSLFSLANLVAPAGVDNPLPVELISFTVENENNSARLTWLTGSELNNDYFAVERSVDGTVFEEVSRVAGAGTIATDSRYSWLDRNPQSGNNYYRLRQVDFNGEFSYSNVVCYKNDNGTETSLTIFPVPTQGSFIYFSRRTSVQVINSRGFLVSSFENVDRIDISSLSSGLYFIKDESGRSHKVILAK